MNEELEAELERLKSEKIVSEKTAQIYLSELRKLENSESQSTDPSSKN